MQLPPKICHALFWKFALPFWNNQSFIPFHFPCLLHGIRTNVKTKLSLSSKHISPISICFQCFLCLNICFSPGQMLAKFWTTSWNFCQSKTYMFPLIFCFPWYFVHHRRKNVAKIVWNLTKNFSTLQQNNCNDRHSQINNWMNTPLVSSSVLLIRR